MSFLHKTFRKTQKKNRIGILYPKKYDEHTYHFAMEVPPWGEGGKINYSNAEALHSVWLKGCSPQVELKSRKTKESGISHLRENGPHSSEEGNPCIETNLQTGCLRKIDKKREHKSPPEHTFIWRLALFELEIINIVFPIF